MIIFLLSQELKRVEGIFFSLTFSIVKIKNLNLKWIEFLVSEFYQQLSVKSEIEGGRGSGG